MHVCVRARACVSVCPSQAISRKLLKSPHRQTWHGDCLSYENASRVNYFDLDLHIQGHTDLNHDNFNIKMTIKFAVKIVQFDYCQSDDLDLHSRSQDCLKLDYFLTCSISDFEP